MPIYDLFSCYFFSRGFAWLLLVSGTTTVIRENRKYLTILRNKFVIIDYITVVENIARSWKLIHRIFDWIKNRSEEQNIERHFSNL